MTYDELIALITPAQREDWLRDEHRSICTLKRDVNVTIREVSQEEPRPFRTEPWATGFADPNAVTLVFELWYGASYVKEYYFAAVDGLPALLPYPKSKDELTITREEYAVAQAVNMQNRLDEYLSLARITIAEDSAARPLEPVH